MSSDKPGNVEICKRITVHFVRNSAGREDADRPVLAYKRGGFVRLRYRSWTSTVSGWFAWEFLKWLDSGNVGDHFEFAAARARQRAVR